MKEEIYMTTAENKVPAVPFDRLDLTRSGGHLRP